MGELFLEEDDAGKDAEDRAKEGEGGKLAGRVFMKQPEPDKEADKGVDETQIQNDANHIDIHPVNPPGLENHGCNS